MCQRPKHSKDFDQTDLSLRWAHRSFCEMPLDKTNKMTVCPVKTQISLGICPIWSESSLGLQKFWNPNRSTRQMMSSTSYEHAFNNPKKSRKLMTHHFHPKEYQKLIIFLILCSLWNGPKRIWVGKRPKHVCQSLTLNFYSLFTFNLVSFFTRHA